MKRILAAFLAVVLPAAIIWAADNQITVTNGVDVPMKTLDVGSGRQAMQPVISNSSGTPYGTAANPFTVTSSAFTVTGPLAVTQSGTWNIATVTALTGITNPIAATQSGTWNIGTVSTVTALTTLGTITNTVAVSSTTIERVRVDNIPHVICDSGCASSSASTATISSFQSQSSSVQLLASNASRKGVILTNTSNLAAYVKFGTTASTTSFTILMSPGAYWEMSPNLYTGRIDAIWASAGGTGSLFVTEQ